MTWQRAVRTLIQFSFMAVALYVGFGRQLGLRVPTVDAVCPFGALEGAWHLITQGRYLGKLFPSNLIVGAALLVSILVAGGAFCGWVCPLGTLQDLLAAAGRRLRLPRLAVPRTIETHLTRLRFLVLAGILWLTIRATELVFSEVCPYRTIFSGTWLFAPTSREWLAYTLAAAIVLASLFVTRAWCRFLCPLGAAVSILSRFSLARVRANPEACTGCGICRRACPMNLNPQADRGPALSCTMCLDCVRACPRPEALALSCRWPRLLPGRTAQLLPLAAALIFAGVIVLANSTGAWTASGMGQAYYTAILTGERLAPEDIRGWMTLENVSRATGVPLDLFYTAGGLPPDLPPSTPLRELERLVGFETQDARQIVAGWYREHPDARIEPGDVARVKLKGRTTLDEIGAAWDVPLDRLLELLGLPPATPGSASLSSLDLRPAAVQRVLEEHAGEGSP